MVVVVRARVRVRGGNDYSIENTINNSGLSFEYASGKDDFDSYLTNGPTHTSFSDGNELFSWDFGKRGVANFTVTNGFNALTSINGFAL